MVRGAADRATAPAREFFEEIGDMMILTGKTIVSAVRPPFPYGGDNPLICLGEPDAVRTRDPRI